MGATLLGLGLKLLGFGQTILSLIWDAIKGICKFAVKKPFQFFTIAFALGLMWAGWYGFQTKQELVKTQQVVQEKVEFIKGQDKTIKEYVGALDTEKKNHVSDIKKSNEAIDNLKKVADEALARAQAAGVKAQKAKAKYDQMAQDYGRANPSTGDPADRIKREEQTNDAFFKNWRKAQ